MAEETKTIIMDGGANTVPAYMANGGAFGFGNNTIGDLIGLAIVASIFGWNNGGFGGFGGGNAGGAGFISNQLNNDSSRELLMQAITANGEASRAAISNLSTMLGQDFNLVNASIQNVQNVLSSIGAAQGLSTLQVINAVQSGDANLTSAIQNACCENRLGICQQTNAIQASIAGVNENIAATRAAQQLADCQQAYALTETMNRNYSMIDNKLDAMESSRKDREITALTAKIAQLESQNFTSAVVGQAMAPINAQLSALAREVDDVKCSMPQTVPVQWPQIQAINTTPNMGGYYGYGYGTNLTF